MCRAQIARLRTGHAVLTRRPILGPLSWQANGGMLVCQVHVMGGKVPGPFVCLV